jgi:hypothetical protein
VYGNEIAGGSLAMSGLGFSVLGGGSILQLALGLVFIGASLLVATRLFRDRGKARP